MAKQIVAWCDVHMARGEHVPGVAVRVALNGRAEREVDLCEPCIKELVDPLGDLIEEVGQPVLDGQPLKPRGSSDKPPYANCPLCGNPSRTRDTLSKHLKRMHDKMITDEDIVRALEVQQVSGPLPVSTGRDKPYSCPTCGDTFETPQGVGAHRNKTHGYRKGDDDDKGKGK